jgi:hypothetical protein
VVRLIQPPHRATEMDLEGAETSYLLEETSVIDYRSERFSRLPRSGLVLPAKGDMCCRIEFTYS